MEGVSEKIDSLMQCVPLSKKTTFLVTLNSDSVVLKVTLTSTRHQTLQSQIWLPCTPGSSSRNLESKVDHKFLSQCHTCTRAIVSAQMAQEMRARVRIGAIR